jgi:hypothetical protein
MPFVMVVRFGRRKVERMYRSRTMNLNEKPGMGMRDDSRGPQKYVHIEHRHDSILID